jgi:hypothetical protein
VLDVRFDIAAKLSVSEIFQFNRDSHPIRNFIGWQLPIPGANRSKPHQMWWIESEEQPYAQLMLKTGSKDRT